MTRLLALLMAVAAAMLLPASPAAASGDVGCTPEWKLAHADLSGCDNMGLLGPGNDTRVNLAMLLLDRRGGAITVARGAEEPALFGWWTFVRRLFPGTPQPGEPGYAEGEGSRCRSNARGTTEFEAALGAARGIPPAERNALAAARRALDPDCAGPTAGEGVLAAAAGVKSAVAKEFARYLVGALNFYDADYDRATRQFGSLADAADPWLKETACYMLARVEVNRAQVGAFDEYGFPANLGKVDRAVTGAALTAIARYLEQYPRGRYAGSAIGLTRKVRWLEAAWPRLAATYSTMLGQDPARRGIADVALLDEIDTKLLPDMQFGATADTALLATLALQRIRPSTGNYDGSGPRQLARAELEALRPRFASDPALFDFLLATHAFYVAGAPRDVLKLIPDAARQQRFTYLQFSRQMLRGMALESLKDRNARGFWLDVVKGANAPFQHPAAELALAYHEERAGGLDRVFAPGSPVRDREIRELLLMHAAGPALLRQQARDRSAPRHERDLALFTLLYKQVTRGAYSGFLADLALVPADASETMSYDLASSETVATGIFARPASLGDYDCPALRETAGQLARSPKASKPLLCLADFMRANGFDDFQLDSPPDPDRLGGSPSQFPGASFSRLEIYKAIIADPKAPGPDKAYALYRAVYCYATAGNNSCGGTEVPVAQRKAWFTRLKREYPGSRWAQELKYYW